MNYLQPQTCKAVGVLLLQKMNRKNTLSQKPPVSRESFWQFQIDQIDMGYKRYMFPNYAADQLTTIAQYCNQHEINLSFLIFPTHSDLQERIDRAQLRDQEISFKQFLASLATVHDFDKANSFTTNRLNFDDPKHVCFTAMDQLITSYWNSKKIQYN